MELSRCDAFRPCSRNSLGQKSYSVLLAKENCNWSMPLAVRLYLPVQYYHFKTSYLQLLTTTSYCLLKAFKICRCFKATAEIYGRNLQTM